MSAKITSLVFTLESSKGGHPNKGYSKDITPNCHNCCNLYLFMLFISIDNTQFV